MTGKQQRAQAIGKRLVELRGIKTRAGVAQATGIPYGSLCFYERGQRIPTDDAKEKLAAYYGLTVQELFYGFENSET